ncbi:hypothetical protein OAO01_00075 [Oligoflexia bacterium]|nr:hypothetical protein [Oligoflexia bacterium]
MIRETVLLIFMLPVLPACQSVPTDKAQEGSATEVVQQSRTQARSTAPEVYFFQRVAEPTQNAFFLLAPKGWIHRGGMFFVDPVAAGGPGNSTEAKVNFSIQADPQGTAMIHWAPDYFYCDMRYSAAAVFFPKGSNYQGMQVHEALGAFDFIERLALPQFRPQAQNVVVVEKQALPELAASYKSSLGLPGTMGFTYDAGVMTVSYSEGGVHYQEKIFTIIQNLGQAGGGMWGNKATVLVRAPVKEWSNYTRLFEVIHGSVRLNPQWLAAELRNRARREKTLIETNRSVQNLDQQIMQSHMKTNADISNTMYLNLTSQEEYINPHTEQVELGTNSWNYRWQRPNGDIIYTDNVNYDPTRDPTLDNNSEYRKSKIYTRRQ